MNKINEVSLLRRKRCHITNYLLTQLARVVVGNIDPWTFLYGLRCARSVLSRPWANISQYGPRARLARGQYLFCIISAQQFYITTLKMHIWFIAILLLGVSYYKSYLLICSLICNLLNGESPRNLHCCLFVLSLPLSLSLSLSLSLCFI